MAEVRKQHFCTSCNAQRVFARPRPNRALNVILAILTCGLWLLVWPLWAAIRAGSTLHCVVCGEPYKGGPVETKVLA